MAGGYKLKLQGKSKKTIDAYSRAVRRISEHFDCCPDQLTLEQREKYFSELVESHSWSTVKVDRNGLQFFWKHVLVRDWQWIKIVKAPKVQSLPDILTTTMPCRPNIIHGFYRVICTPSRQSHSAGHRWPVNCSLNAPTAATLNGGPDPVDTAVAHSVRITKPRFGWIVSRPNFYRLSILW